MDPFADTGALVTPLRAHELADTSSADHEFAILPRQILVAGTGALVIRLVDSTEDLTVTFGAGSFQLLPWRVRTVRQATAVTVVGLS